MLRLHILCVSALLGLGGCDSPTASKTDAPRPALESKGDAPAPARSDLPNAEELLAAVVEASGGGAKLDAITSFSQEMTVEMLGAGIKGPGKSWSKGDDFYLELSLPGVGTTMGGGKGGKMWTVDPIQGLRTLDGKEAEAAAMGTSLNIAHDWKRFFDRAETTKVEEVGGTKFAEVKLTANKSGNEVVLRIDLGNHRIVSQRLKQYSSMGEIPVEVTLSDYRELDGVWFAFEQLADMKLQKIKTTTTKLELNVPVDETKFAMPGSEPTSLTDKTPTETKAPADAKAERRSQSDATKAVVDKK
jgi:hypothetical protein